MNSAGGGVGAGIKTGARTGPPQPALPGATADFFLDVDALPLLRGCIVNELCLPAWPNASSGYSMSVNE